MALTSKLTNIADAIRNKTGGTEPLTLDGMANVILGFKLSDPDEVDYTEALIERTIESYSNSNIRSIGYYAFYKCTSLTEVRLPAATSLGNYAFSKCTSLTKVDLPVANSIGDNTFYNCTSLTEVDLSVATSMGNGVFYNCTSLTKVDLPVANSIGDNTFYNCTSLTEVDLSVATSIGYYAFYKCAPLTEVRLPAATSLGNYAFSYCTSLTKVDLPAATSLDHYAFSNCASLITVILRSETICTTGVPFSYCDHFMMSSPEDSMDGYIYVPKALIEDYKVATNWSTYASQFRALEDYTVDGTTTGELDESKI